MPFNAEPLTQEENDELDKILGQLMQAAGVQGVVIVNFDGLILASTIDKIAEQELLAIWSLAIHLNTQTVTQKWGHHNLQQIILTTKKEHVLITDWTGGILVTLVDAEAALPFIIPGSN